MRLKKYNCINDAHLEAQFGHHLWVGLLDSPDLIGQYNSHVTLMLASDWSILTSEGVTTL